ncbi:sulfite exporter TauE/SafE family protein [soil metagenome]
MFVLLAIAAAGFIAQLVDGSLGMGYGITSTSLLLALGLTPAIASASVHMAEIGTSAVSGAAHWKMGNVDWRVLLMLGVPGGVGAFAGAVVLSNLSLDVARPWVSVVLLVLGAIIILRFVRGRRRPARPTADLAPAGRHQRWLLTPLGLFGGFLDASGGGGWGPTTTSTLMAAGRMRPRTIIGTVSGSEFIVSVAASAGFLLVLGATLMRWDVVAMMLVGGAVAAPVAAWLVSRFDDRSLGSAVGGVIILLNVDRVLMLVGMDPALGGIVRVVSLALAGLVIVRLVARGRVANREAALEAGPA